MMQRSLDTGRDFLQGFLHFYKQSIQSGFIKIKNAYLLGPNNSPFSERQFTQVHKEIYIKTIIENLSEIQNKQDPLA